MSLNVLFEDNHLIAVYKKAGDLVQGDKTEDITLMDDIKAYLKQKYDKPGNVFLGLIHRIDRPVSGVVLYARTSKALERLNAQFKDRTVSKTYLAFVKDVPNPEEGELTHFLLKNNEQNKSKAFLKEKSGAKQSTLTYKLLGISNHKSLLEVVPFTGRHHQIRTQLSTIGHPIVGDLKYGYPSPNKQEQSICLHAWKLAFDHPVTKQRILVKAPLPKTPDWKEAAALL